MAESILSILAYGAWNGGTLVDNSYYENKGMIFKNNIPVNSQTIEERIGVRTRMAAPEDARIGVMAFENLLNTNDVDPSRIRFLIGATNIGEDKYDPGPQVRYPWELIRKENPDVIALDLYAGCPGYNVAVELLFMLSITGALTQDDLSVVVGSENIHRARAFRASDTASIIFGDDALATAFLTRGSFELTGQYSASERGVYPMGTDPVGAMATAILEVTGDERIDGLIIDNHLGKIQRRVPAVASRVQHRMVELMYPEAVKEGVFTRFKDALRFYDERVDSFAFDIMTMTDNADIVEMIAKSYVCSGKYKTIVSVHAGATGRLQVTVHKGQGFTFTPPTSGIVDTATSTHGCFGQFIQADTDESDGDVYGEMDGKGVFLYATRGVSNHLRKLLEPNQLTIRDIDLLIEHQANFAMIPLTLEQLLADGAKDLKTEVATFIAKKTVINIHSRGNCSVVCMQRLPYDLQRGALKPDSIQGIPINRNLDTLRQAGIILNDSVGAGMTRSSFLQKL
jgi:3-oxoacyl-[acyl-carrier-protein] synthase III